MRGNGAYCAVFSGGRVARLSADSDLTPIAAGILSALCLGFLAHAFYARKFGFSFFKTLLSFAEGKVSYDVYGCGGEETFESQTSPLGDALENKRKIGNLRTLRFIPETPN